MEEILSYIAETIAEHEEKVLEMKDQKRQHEVRFNSGVILGLEMARDFIEEYQEGQA